MLTALLCVIAAPAALGQETHLHITVVDDATGAPIVGAQVLGVEEARTPVWGERWFQVAATTSADGTVDLPRSTEGAYYSWLMVEADGYGTWGTMVSSRSDGSVVRLQPEVPITIAVVDFMGRHLPLAHVGVCFGCGHTPDLISVVTGADGRATLHGVRDYDSHIEDLYVVHPQTSMISYDSVPYGDVVDGVARVYCDPGMMIEGQVLMPDGKPAVGYGVGNNPNHRGHWAVTDERGQFRLYGVELQGDQQTIMSPTGELVAAFEGSRHGVYRTFALNGTNSPKVYEDGLEEAKPWTRKVTIQVEVEVPEGDAVPNLKRWIPVEVWDPVTGRMLWGETNEEGAVSFMLTVGDYCVEVGGPGSAFHARPLAPLLVGNEDPETPMVRVCALPAPRMCTIDVTGLQEEESLSIETAGGHYAHWWARASKEKPVRLALPSGPFGAHFMRRGEDEVWRRVQVELPHKIGAQLTIRCPQ